MFTAVNIAVGSKRSSSPTFRPPSSFNEQSRCVALRNGQPFHASSTRSSFEYKGSSQIDVSHYQVNSTTSIGNMHITALSRSPIQGELHQTPIQAAEGRRVSSSLPPAALQARRYPKKIMWPLFHDLGTPITDTKNAVCFGLIRHAPSKMWRDTIKTFSNDTASHPKWSDGICDQVIHILESLGIHAFLIFLDPQGVRSKKVRDEHNCCANWFQATYQEVLERTKQRFLDDRKPSPASAKRPWERPQKPKAKNIHALSVPPALSTCVSHDDLAENDIDLDMALKQALDDEPQQQMKQFLKSLTTKQWQDPCVKQLVRFELHCRHLQIMNFKRLLKHAHGMGSVSNRTRSGGLLLKEALDDDGFDSAASSSGHTRQRSDLGIVDVLKDKDACLACCNGVDSIRSFPDEEDQQENFFSDLLMIEVEPIAPSTRHLCNHHERTTQHDNKGDASHDALGCGFASRDGDDPPEFLAPQEEDVCKVPAGKRRLVQAEEAPDFIGLDSNADSVVCVQPHDDHQSFHSFLESLNEDTPKLNDIEWNIRCIMGTETQDVLGESKS